MDKILGLFVIIFRLFVIIKVGWLLLQKYFNENFDNNQLIWWICLLVFDIWLITISRNINFENTNQNEKSS